MGSLINRVEISNFLDRKNNPTWQPSYPHAILGFEGQNSALLLANGTGKSTITTAILGTLSRHKELVSRMKGTFAPKKSGIYSHVRVEWVVPTAASSQENLFGVPNFIRGETYVFGVCGFSDDKGGLKYYCYPGRLEDVPIVNNYGGSTRVDLLLNEEFEAAIKNRAGARYKVGVEDWQDRICQHISELNLDQNVSFHLKGGGDASASLYQTKVARGEKYDKAFFLSHLAPYIATGSESISGEGSFFLDDTILRNAIAISEVQIAGERKEARLKKQQAAADVFLGLAKLKDNIGQAEQNYQDSQEKITEIASALQSMVLTDPLPGVPRAFESSNKVLKSLVHNIVIISDEPQKPFLIKDAGLAGLLGKETRVINQTAMRKKVESTKEPYFVEIPCDLADNKQLGGHGCRLFTQENAIRFLDTVDDDYFASQPSGFNRDQCKDVLGLAFMSFAESCDSNPIRENVQNALQALEKMRAESRICEGKIGDIEAQKTALMDSLGTYTVNKNAYDKLKNSGLFSEEELQDPLEAKRNLAGEAVELKKCIRANTGIFSSLAQEYKLYQNFQTEFAGVNPAERAEELQAEGVKLKAASEKSAGEMRALKEQLQGARKKQGESERALQRLRAEHEKIAPLKASFDTVSESFVGEEILGFYDRITAQINENSKAITATEIELGEAQKRYGHEIRFYKEIGAVDEGGQKIDPSAWLEKIGEEREQLSHEKRSLETSMAQLLEEQKILAEDKVAPGVNAMVALKLIPADIAYQPLHVFLKEQVADRVRLEKLLAAFSAFLFAPVLDDVKNIGKIVNIFNKQNKDILLPVFHFDQFSRLLADADMIPEQEGDISCFLVSGRKSDLVECILDSAKIEKRKTEVAEEIAVGQDRLNAMKKRLAEIGQNSGTITLATLAAESVREKLGLKVERLSRNLKTLKEEASHLQSTYSSDVIATIRKAERFLHLGGMAQFEKGHSACIEGEKIHAEQFAHYELLDANYTKLEKDTEDARDAFAQFGSTHGATIVNLQKVATFIDRDLSRYLEAKKLVEDSEKREEQVEKKRDFDFNRADAFVKAMDLTTEQDLQKRYKALDAKVASLQEKKRTLAEGIAGAEQEGLSYQKACSKYDRFLANIFSLYYKVAANAMGTLVAGECAEAKGLVALLVDSLADKQYGDALEHCYSIEEYFEHSNFDVLNTKAKQASNRLLAAQKSFYDRCQEEMAKRSGDTPLGDQEKDLVREIQNAPEELQHILRRIEDALARGFADLEQGKKDEAKIKADLATNLASLTNRASSNLKLLRRVLKEHDGATFLIEARIASYDEIVASIEDMITIIKTRHQAYRAQQLAEGVEDAQEDRKHELSLKEIITDRCYRSIFLEPSIKFVHPDIRDNNPTPFDIREENVKLSGGQKTSLALLMQVIMARYAQRKKFNEQMVAGMGAHGNGADSPSVLIIDGLFSSLSKPALIKEAFKCIKGTSGSFQIIGLIHNSGYLSTHDYDVFPNLFVGQEYKVKGESGDRGEWVVFDKRQKELVGSVGFASFRGKKKETEGDKEFVSA